MAEGFVEAGRISGYHAHVYYHPETRERAERLRGGIAERFAARLGSWHDEPVGPHPVAMYQVAFAIDEFSPTQRGGPPFAGSQCVRRYRSEAQSRE